MATVLYSVLYKYIHPLTRNPITNKQTDYDAYGSVVERTTGLSKPSSWLGDWPKEQVKIRPLMIGTRKTGIDRDEKYLDELSDFDVDTINLKTDIELLKKDLETKVNEKEKAEEEKKNALYLIQKEHPNGGYTITAATGAIVWKNSGYNPSLSLGLTSCSCTPDRYNDPSWNHSGDCTTAAFTHSNRTSIINSLNNVITTLKTQLETKQSDYDSRIGKIAPQAEKNYVTDRNYPDSPLFDMLFYFDTAKLAFSKDYSFDVSSVTKKEMNTEVYVDTFQQVKGNPWFVASEHGSLQAAMKSAGPLIKRLGKNNVKIVKNVPVDVTVHIE